MELEVKKDFENKMLNRREISIVAKYDGKTPTKETIKEEICKKLSLNPDATVVVKVNQLYGVTESEVLVHAYKQKEQMVEPKYLFERGAKKKQAGAAQESAPKAAEQEKKENEESAVAGKNE